ncbi:Vitamin B12 transporter BtuB [Sporomusa rhizae]|uniref:TonB-dependent receptor n=1 Tax=Sporomusa rhizae TaxID=357999 RepID=UPI00352A5B14
MNSKKRNEFLKRSIVMALVLGSSAMLNVAQAEETPVYDMDTVVVTATKVEQSVKDVPASVTVITAKDIEKMNVQTIDQALRMAGGVFDKRSKGITDTTASISLRGFSGSGRTLVLLDGQPLNQAYAGSVNWAAIPMQSIERIEVVKGSNSALYGAQAMGGVINIITKNPRKSDARISLKYESYNTWTQQLEVGDKLSDKFSYRLGYERKTSDGYASSLTTSKNKSSNVTGYRDTADYITGAKTYIIGDKGNNTWEQDNVHAKFVYNFDDKRSLTFGIQHDKSEYGYGQGHNYLVKSDGTPYTNGLAYSFLSGPGGKETNVYSLGYKDKENGIVFNLGLTDMASNWYITPPTSSTSIPSISETPNRRWNMDLQKELQLNEKNRMVVGINYRNDWIHNMETNLKNWNNKTSKLTLKSEAEGRAQTVGLFVQNEHKINDKFSLTIGGRYDSWKNQDEINNGNDRSDSAFSPKVALLYKQNDSSQIYVSAGKSFNPPDMYNMYRTWTSINSDGTTGTLYMANPDLKAETVTTAELGWRKQLSENTTANISYFHNKIDNMVYKKTLLPIVQNGVTLTPQRYENAGEGTTNGVELELSHKFNTEWSGFFNYTWQNAIISKNSVNLASEGKQVTGIPKQIVNFGFDYKKDKVSGNVFGSYVSKRYGKDDNTDVVNDVPQSYDPYFIVNANVQYQWDKNNSVTLGVDNLFDRQYFDYYVAPGRTYSIQVSHKF